VSVDVAQADIITVCCAACGDALEISKRSWRRYRQRGRLPCCHICQVLARRPAPLHTMVVRRYHNFWLKDYSLEWIEETAQMIWGEQ
jgi:hypothetical protein